MNKKYYSLVTSEDVATINIYGDITSWPWLDSDVSAYNLSKQLDEISNVNEIHVYINSYGGEVAEGLAIYNALKRKSKEAKVITYCDGFACSIASVIFMAGQERKMSNASLLMIHNAWTYGSGNAAELRKLAEDLDVITSASVEAYKAVAAISEEEIKALMDSESWIAPKDAVNYGFATEIIEEECKKPSQCARNTVFDIITKSKAEQNLTPNRLTKDPEKANEEDTTATPAQNIEKTANEMLSGFFNAISKIKN